MAIQQIRVPWTPGYDIGVGADLASGSPMNSPVKAEATPVDQAAGTTIDLQIQRINSTEELEQALGVDAEASYGCASFGPSMSARFSFSKQSKVQASSLFMTVSVRVQLEFLSIDSPQLTEKAAEAIANPEVFEAKYGNMFVRGIGRGGLFVGVLRIDTGSSEESMKISAELSGSYGLFAAEAKSKLEKIQNSYKNEVFVRQYQEGGPKNLTIDDPSNPQLLLDNAQAFLKSFDVATADVSKVAVPFFVTLAPTTIAEGPLPPNSADIQRAQDVLIYCARKRSALLDDLNLIQYVAENPSKFLYTDEIKAETIQETVAKLQDDLMVIADCASAAIMNRSTAKYPEQFAEEKGIAFPTGRLPKLPVAVAPVRTVLVPDFSTCADQAACEALAKEKEVVATYVSIVMTQDPAPGTQVDVGSKVRIFHPAATPLILVQGALTDAILLKMNQ
jgi:hypothetical protein